MPKLSLKTNQFISMAIVALGFALRLYTLASESLWYDELLQVNIAQDTIPSILRRLPDHSALPLDYLISHYWIMMGRSDIWVRMPAVIIATLSLPIAYQVGQHILGKRQGLLFMVLLACSPFHVRYSQEVRPYALIVLGILVAVYAFWRLEKTGAWRYAILLQVGVLIFSMAHYFAILIFGPLLILACSNILSKRLQIGLSPHNKDEIAIENANAHQKAYKNSLKALGILIITGLVVFSILLALGWGRTLFNVSTAFSQTLVEPERFTVDATEKPNLGEGPQITWLFIERNIFGVLGAGTTSYSMLLFNVLVGLGLLKLIIARKYKQVLFFTAWLILPPVIILAFLIQRGTFFAPRYIISILPAYLMLLSIGIFALPIWLKRLNRHWLSIGVLLGLSAMVFVDLGIDLERLYHNKDKEDWHRVANFIIDNVGPNDAIIAVKAEPTMNWYYPPATTPGNTYTDLETIKSTVAQAERSWVILSIFSSGIDPIIKAWLSENEQGAIQFNIDPIISVYYLGHQTDHQQLLEEVQEFVLPVDHAIYAHLARENRRRPHIARRYYELAISNAPDDETRAEYEKALQAIE